MKIDKYYHLYGRKDDVFFEEVPNPKPHWIPVTERIPEEDGSYLTTTVFGEVYCDYWKGCCFDRTEAIIAWMPLPEPYKEKENDR